MAVAADRPARSQRWINNTSTAVMALAAVLLVVEGDFGTGAVFGFLAALSFYFLLRARRRRAP
jgi:hypothetical protein